MSSRRPPQLEKRAASMFCQYKLGYSLETIGKNFNISRQRVHKIISENPDYKPIKRDIALRDALGNHRRWYRILMVDHKNLTKAEISQLVSMGYHTVTKVIKKYGIETKTVDR